MENNWAAFEEEVARRIANSGNFSSLKIFRDILIPNGDRTSEVDVVALTNKCLLVVECKDYGGTIYGSDTSRNWQVYYTDDERHQFYNPLMQNKTHTNALIRYLNLRPIDIMSFAVFSNRSTLKVSFDGPESDTLSFGLCRINEFSNRLRQAFYSGGVRFDKNEFRRIEGLLNNCDVGNCEGRERHVETVSGCCLFCGGKLILRHGPYGDFYGCENYPKCKYTKNVTT